MNKDKHKKFEDWVKQLFSDRLSEDISYHNLQHTLLIVEKSLEIAKEEKLSKHENEEVYFAAWLHDTGYCVGQPSGHEERGAEIAQDQLAELGWAQDRIDHVKQAIRSTQVPQRPKSSIDRILCDADLYHLGLSDFETYSNLLRKEIESLRKKKFTDLEWWKGTLEFFNSHQFHTVSTRKKLDFQKQKNRELIQEKIKNMELKNKSEKPKKTKKAKRGIETLYRITSKNHLELSGLADNKANIMISVNSIIISIIVSVLIRKLEEFPNYLIPTILMIATCLVAMIFAILATRPKVSKGNLTQEDIENKKGNLLYFGNFHNMTESEYLEGIKELRNDEDYLYDSLSRDIYYLGKILTIKYQYLRKSYSIFMYGFIISVLAFLIATLFFDPYQY